MVDAELRAALLQQEMRDIRGRTDDDVQTIVDRARTLKGTLTDWHYYVRKYPLWCAAGAAAVGYLIVPQKKQTVRLDAETLRAWANDKHVTVEADARPPRSSLFKQAATAAAMMAARSLLNGGLATVAAQVQQFMQSRAAAQAEPTPTSEERSYDD